MTATLKLLGKVITYESAAEHQSDILRQSTFVPNLYAFYTHLWHHRSDIQDLVSHHVGLTTTETCVVSQPKEWIRGSFNLCVPVVIWANGKPSRKVLMRWPMPHAFAESAYPGTMDEKIGCEVATYAWIEHNCPTIPIPHLWGFGFSDGRTYTHATHRSFHIRIVRFVQRFLHTFLRRPFLSSYTAHPSQHSFNTGYILLEYIEPTTGTMLSNSWKQHMTDRIRRENLFRGLSRIILSLARLPQPRIGSFKFHDDGTISLTNRPLTCPVAIFENYGAPRIIDQHTTYTTVEPYVSDLLTYHDNRFIHQPDAVENAADCHLQMAVKTVLRAVGHHYFNRDLRNGPFVLYLTDLHQSNILVDDNWNITKLIDLEWICSLPVEFGKPPYWLTGLEIDQIQGDGLDAFNSAREEFMKILGEEEAKFQFSLPGNLLVSELWQTGWNKGTFWYCLSLTSINGMYNLFHHICGQFSTHNITTTGTVAIFPFWIPSSQTFVEKKVAEKVKYDVDLRNAFEEPDSKTGH